MKQVKILKPHQIVVADVAESAPPGAGELLLDVEAIGICGSDLHTLEGLHPFVSYPVLPGHEVCGVVREAGEGVSRALIGKFVSIEPSLYCGSCRNCLSGRYNICEDLKVLGFQLPGAMADSFVVSAERAHVLPDDFPETAGVFVEPLAVAVHAARLAGDLKGTDIAVIGAGTIGLLVGQVVRAYGAGRVCVVEPDSSRKKIAASLDFETTQEFPANSADMVFECVGVEAALRSAIASCRKGATVMVVGVFGKDAKIQAGLIQDWELRLIGSLMYTGEDYTEAIRLLGEDKIRFSDLVTHRFSLEDAPEAFEVALRRGDVLKVILKPSG